MEPPAADAAAASPEANQASLVCNYEVGLDAATNEFGKLKPSFLPYRHQVILVLKAFMLAAGLNIKATDGSPEKAIVTGERTAAEQAPAADATPKIARNQALLSCDYSAGIEAATQALVGAPSGELFRATVAVEAFVKGAGLMMAREKRENRLVGWLYAADPYVQASEAQADVPELTDATKAMIRDVARSMVHDMVQAAISDYDQMLPTRVRRIIETSQTRFGS